MPPVLQWGGGKMWHWSSPFSSSSTHQNYRPHRHLPHPVAAVTVSGQCTVDSAVDYSLIDNCYEFMSQTCRFVSQTSRRPLTTTMFGGVSSRTLVAVTFSSTNRRQIAAISGQCRPLNSCAMMIARRCERREIGAAPERLIG